MKYTRDEMLRPYNTLRLQARAHACVTIGSDKSLIAALDWARKRNLRVIPLGEGSNIVLAGDVHALVMLQRARGIEIVASTSDTVRLRVAAGENWHALVTWSLKQGYYGLQNLAYIPGTVGAAPIQNVGAYGVELQSVIRSVNARQIADGRRVTLDREACEFGYRDSVFKHRLQDQLVITDVEMELNLHPQVNTAYPALANHFLECEIAAPTPEQVFEAVVSIRRSKLPDPAVEPNAGSFFKNPVLNADIAHELMARFPALPAYPQADGRVKVPAAWLIEYCGWKGVREEGTGVHPHHALVLVNYGDDNGCKLLSLAHEISSNVHDTFAVQLEIEPRVYGTNP